MGELYEELFSKQDLKDVVPDVKDNSASLTEAWRLDDTGDHSSFHPAFRVRVTRQIQIIIVGGKDTKVEWATD